METLITKKVLYGLSLPLIVLLIFTSAMGLLHPEIYAGATKIWFVQTVGQDAIDLFLVVPVLLFSTLYAGRGSRIILAAWAGTNIYVMYTFVIYCFDVRFNSLFFIYCLILGLSSYSTAIFLYKSATSEMVTRLSGVIFRKVLGYAMISLAAIFYVVWLADVIPAAWSGKIPQGLVATGLPTNPVHVIDLAVVLPLVALVGVLVLREHSFATALAPSIIVFFVLMDITIVTLSLMLFENKLEEGHFVAIIMGVHTVMSIAALVYLVNNLVYRKQLMS